MHVNGLRNKFCEDDDSVIASARACLTPMFADKPCTVMPVFSSGQSARQAPGDLCGRSARTDLIVTAGGGIMAHPDGPAAGVSGAARSVGRGDGRHPARASTHGRIRRCAARWRWRHDDASDRCRKGRSIAFYGDDFTGSSAVMEALAFAGLPTVLFLDAADAGAPAGLRRLPRHRHRRRGALAEPGMDGRATCRRSSGRCAALGAPVVHYKVCSTFDSAPHVGSIGRAIDIGGRISATAGSRWSSPTPAWVASRLSATCSRRCDGTGYRLDRHPTMSRHPVTPMDEADLGVHLAQQTDKTIGLVDFVAMKRGRGRCASRRELDAEGAGVVVARRARRGDAGRGGPARLGARRRRRPFGVGSQGLEAALVAYWRAAGLLPERRPRTVGGASSASPACLGLGVPGHGSQIAYAVSHGFSGIRIDAASAVDEATWEKEIGRATQEALRALSDGSDPLVFTATGPDDPAVAARGRRS